MTTNWESISPPRGSFVGWSNEIGQNVTGKVLTVGEGKDRNQNPCPEISVELSQDAFTFSVAKGRTELEAGTVAIVTCGLSNLKKNILAAALRPGDLVSITLESLYPTDKSPAKIFDVKVARGAAPVSSEVGGTVTNGTPAGPWGAAQPSFAGFGTDEPPTLSPKAPF